MKPKIYTCIALILLGTIVNTTVYAQFITAYPKLPGAANAPYTVTVDNNTVAGWEISTHMDHPAAHFAFTGSVTVEVTRSNTSSAKVFTSQGEISSSFSGDKVTFTLSSTDNYGRSYVAVVFDNNFSKMIYILGDPPESSPPTGETTDIKYYGPGIHTLSDWELDERDMGCKTQLYLAPGAVLKSFVRIGGIEGLKVFGRGAILAPTNSEMGVTIKSSVAEFYGINNLEVEGIFTLADGGDHWTMELSHSKDITLYKNKNIGRGQRSDPLTLVDCSNVNVSAGLYEGGDNIFVVGPWRASGNFLLEDLLIQNTGGDAVLFLQGEIGFCPNSPIPLLSDIEFRDSYVIRSTDLVNVHGFGNERNYDNIILENIGVLSSNSSIFSSTASSQSVIADFYFKNVRVPASMGEVDLDQRNLRLHFQDVYYGGDRVDNVAEANIITFIGSGSSLLIENGSNPPPINPISFPGTYFTDNFSSNTLDDYRMNGGSWSVSGGKLVQSSTSSGVKNIFLGGVREGLANVRWQADARPTSPDASVSLHVRARSAKFNNLSSRWKLVLSKPSENEVRLIKQIDGNETVVEEKSFTVNQGTSYELRAEALDGEVKFYVNGSLQFTRTDADVFRTGNVVFGVEDGSAEFDNVSLERLNGGTVSCSGGNPNPPGGGNIEIGQWQFNNNSSDAIGSRNATLRNGAGYSTDAVEGSHSLQLDGSNDYAEIPAFRYNDGGAFSIATWIKPDNLNGAQLILAKKTSSTQESVQLLINGDDLIFRVYSGDDNWIGRRVNNAIDTTWQRIVAVYDGGTTASSIKLYRCGTRIDNANDNNGSFTSFNDLNIVTEIGSQNGGSNTFDGHIDDVVLYNYALTSIPDGGVSCGGSSTSSNEVGQWQFNNNGNDVIGSRNATLRNGASYSTDAVEGSHSLLLDGSNDYAEIAAFRYNNGGAFSIAVWIKPDNLSGAQLILAKKTSTTQESIQLLINGDDMIFRVYSGDNDWIGRRANNTINTTWQRIVVTYDGGSSASSLKIYRCGTQIDNANDNNGSFGSFNDLNIVTEVGSQNGGNNNFGGRIDDLIIYNEALTSIPDGGGSCGSVSLKAIVPGKNSAVAELEGIKLFPNPVGLSGINIESSEELQGYRIYDTTGRMIMERKERNKDYFISREDLPANGVLIIEFITKEGVQTKRIVVR